MEWDSTRLPDLYAEARALPPETLAVWARAIRGLLPPGGEVRRVVDLGCGTGRFTGLLADLFGVAALGVDPSLRMLANRELGDSGRARFVAGSAEALPIATGAVDLVFLSMVYHHLRSVPAALDEMRRVLSPGGHVVVRNPTRESHAEGYEFLRFFPEAMNLELGRMPTRAALSQAFLERDFAQAGHEIVYQRFAANYVDSLKKIRLRGLSSLEAISDEAFARGLREFERHCRAAERGQPVYEPVELFVFERARVRGSGRVQ